MASKNKPPDPAAILSQYIPYSQEAEEAVLGAILINPPALLDVLDFLKAEDFFILRHQYIYSLLCELDAADTAIDYVTVIERLKARGILDEIGGPAYLTQLINNTPTSIHAPVYGKLIQLAAVRRRLLSATERIKLLALDEELTVEKIQHEAEVELFGAFELLQANDIVRLGQSVSNLYDHLMRVREGSKIVGIATGFTQIDRYTSGLKKGNLYIIAGRPSMGKSALMQAIGLNVSKKYRQNSDRLQVVILFTGEMSEHQVSERLLAMGADVDVRRISEGTRILPEEWSRITEQLAALQTPMFFIDDKPKITPLHILTVCKRLAYQLGGIDLVLVDYLQLMEADSGETNRYQAVTEISRGLKLAARSLDCPVIAAAQLSRKLEERANKRPILSDLKDSGSIEQDSDAVIFLFRQDYYDQQEGQEIGSISELEVIFAKQRQGPTGTCLFDFNRPLMKFTERILALI